MNTTTARGGLPRPAALRFATILAALALLTLAGCKGDTQTGTSEGTASAPFNLGVISTGGTITHDGSVDEAGSYYSVTGTTGENYTVKLTGLSSDADLFVYDTGSFSGSTTPLCASVNGGTADETCSSLPGPSLYIYVKLYGADPTDFTLTVTNP